MKRLPTLLVLFVIVLITGAQAKAELNLYYIENFNDLIVGSELNGQNGWVAIPGQAFVVKGNAPNKTIIGGGVVSRGSAFGFEALASTPQFAILPDNEDELDYVLTMTIKPFSDRTTWYITPKNISQNVVLTRLKFEADTGKAYILVPDGMGGGDFEEIPGVTWEANKHYDLVFVFRSNSVFQLLVNQRLTVDFESPSFAVGVEQISFETGNERIGDWLKFDNIRARDGKVNNN